MSIFDSSKGWDPSSWLQEKTLAALEETARLVDLANEPDTTPWYAKTLRERAGRLANRLVPVVALLHQAGQQAADHEEWGLMLEGGSFGLARWCKKFGIADPNRIALQAAGALVLDDSEEREGKEEEIYPEVISAEDDQAQDLKLQIYSSRTRRLLHADLSEAERRLELWLLAELWLSPYADTVVVSKKFLPGDIDCTPEDTAESYRAMYERGAIERVDLPDLRPESLALRLVVPGTNDSKHPLPFREESFGFPGARIGGQITSGNMFGMAIPVNATRRLANQSATVVAEELEELRRRIQGHLGDDRVYIETVELAPVGGSAGLRVRLRQRLDDDDRLLRLGIEKVLETWSRSRGPLN